MTSGGRVPRRPGPARWLWYAISARLPYRYRDWVLYDLTCPTWPLRHLARLLVLLVPIDAALIAFLPGPLAVRAWATAIGSVVGLLFTFVFLEDATDRRATKFGFPGGTAQAVREQRARERRAKEERDLYQRDRYQHDRSQRDRSQRDRYQRDGHRSEHGAELSGEDLDWVRENHRAR